MKEQHFVHSSDPKTILPCILCLRYIKAYSDKCFIISNVRHYNIKYEHFIDLPKCRLDKSDGNTSVTGNKYINNIIHLFLKDNSFSTLKELMDQFGLNEILTFNLANTLHAYVFVRNFIWQTNLFYPTHSVSNNKLCIFKWSHLYFLKA